MSALSFRASWTGIQAISHAKEIKPFAREPHDCCNALPKELNSLTHHLNICKRQRYPSSVRWRGQRPHHSDVFIRSRDHISFNEDITERYRSTRVYVSDIAKRTILTAIDSINEELHALTC